MDSELTVDLILMHDLRLCSDTFGPTNECLSEILSEQMKANVTVHESVFDPLYYRFHITKASIKQSEG